MKHNQIPTSAAHTASSTLIALIAGLGINYIVGQVIGISGLFVVALATPCVLLLLLTMLRGAASAAYDQGAISAAVDVGTRLPSPTLARQLLQREFAAAERGRPLTVVVFSLDNLPRLAARQPEETAKLLLGVGAIFKRRTRGMNLSARLDQPHMFVSVLGGVNEEGAAKFVGKVKKDLATLAVGAHSVNVSTGMCAYDPVMHSVDDLLEQAISLLSESDDFSLLSA